MTAVRRARPEADEVLLGFTRALRAAGVAGHPRPLARASWRRRPWSASTTGGRPTGPAGPPCAAGPSTWPATTRSSRPTSTPGTGCPGRAPRPAPSPPRSGSPTSESEGGQGDPDDVEVLRVAASEAEVLRHRDVAAMSAADKQRLAQMFATLQPAAAHASYRPAPGLAPRRPRRLPHPAREPAPDGGAGRDRLATARRAAAAGGAPRRRVGLDERLRRRAAAARAPLHGLHRREARASASRRSRSAPGSPTSPARCGCATPTGPSSRPARPCPTGPGAPGSARRCGSSWTGGASAGWPAVRWW